MGGLRTAVFFLFVSVAFLFPLAVPADNSFPLSAGNSWTYRDQNGNEEVLRIGGTVDRQGIPLVEASYTGRNPFYYTLTAEGLARLEPTSPAGSPDLYGRLTLLISWPLTPGKTWNSPWSDPPLTFTVLERGPVTVAAGTFRRAVRIGYRMAHDPIYQGYMWFAPGVGLLVQEESGSRVELASYSLTDLLPPPVSAAGIESLARLFTAPSGGGNGDATGGAWTSGSRLAPLLGAGVLFMMALALAAYIRQLRIDVELEDDSSVQEGEAILASAMVREGLYGEAAQILQRLTARHPQWPDIAALLGSALRESGRLDEACLELKRALTLNPDMATARLELARTYLDLGDPVRASREVDAVLGDHDEYADAIYLKGQCLLALGREDEALKSFRRALGINPSFEDARVALERLLAE